MHEKKDNIQHTSAEYNLCVCVCYNEVQLEHVV